MAAGFFGKKNGRAVVYVTRDPDNPEVSAKHRRCYFTSSKKGQHWDKIIREYISVRSEYEMLLKDWKSKYIAPPRKISFPLKKRRKNMIDREFFENAVPNQNKREVRNPIEHNGQVFRSKNEILSCEVLEAMGYEYKTEVYLKGNDWMEFYPDLMFYVPELDKVIVFEIDGALDVIVYDGHSFSRTSNYLNCGFVEGKDLICYRISDSKAISIEQIENLIRAAIESSLDDIIN